MKVLICGGGTGGHIYPALAVIEAIEKNRPATDDFLWIGTSGQVEDKLVPRAGIQLKSIEGGAIAGVSWPVRLRNSARLIWSIGNANQIIGQFRPDVLLMTGGYVNAPVAVAASFRRIPIVIYLPDIEPGMAIKYLSKIARRIACTAKQSLAYFPAGKGVVTGYPVRPEMRMAALGNRQQALRQFKLEDDRQTLFVFGGSRGARTINRALMKSLPVLLEKIQIIHISGELDWDEVKGATALLSDKQRSYYRPVPYLHKRMGAAYRAADLVVARAGASMLGECPAFSVPTILVPYPYAWRYQKVNADYLVKQGAAIRLDDERLGYDLATTILDLLAQPSKLDEMSKSARQLDVPEAAENISGVLLAVTKRVAS